MRPDNTSKLDKENGIQVRILNQSSEHEHNTSNKKIKHYLHNELSSNKHLSVNDYKMMTKQVCDLRKLESNYLSESHTQMQHKINQQYNSS